MEEKVNPVSKSVNRCPIKEIQEFNHMCGFSKDDPGPVQEGVMREVIGPSWARS